MTFSLPRAVLEQHTAFLGKTGSGKTSTAKLAVEQIFRIVTGRDHTDAHGPSSTFGWSDNEAEGLVQAEEVAAGD